MVWTSATERPLWLEIDTVAHNQRAEDQLLQYVTHLRRTMRRKHSTIKQKIGAIADRHALAKRVDLLSDMPLLGRAMRTAKREDGASPLKVPASPPVIRRALQITRGRLSRKDAIVARAVLTTGFTFMLRCGEFLSRDARGVDDAKVIRGVDVSLRTAVGPVEKGKEESAEEMWVYQRSAKADQAGEGSVIAHTRVTGTAQEMCPVDAMVDLVRAFPKRTRSEAGLPLFRWSNGEPVQRIEVRDTLRVAAAAEGLPADRVHVHSLRLGGATALWGATGNLQLVQRLGRWRSDAVHRYLWETGNLTRGLAQRMAETSGGAPPGAWRHGLT